MSTEDCPLYWEKLGLEASKSDEYSKEEKSSSTENYPRSVYAKRFEAYQRAHDIRKFEIERFWQRSTYYWAFILAAFTAHFALLGLLFSTFSDSENLKFTLQRLYSMPGLSLFGLAITACFCFFFSYCWVLMNKGSMFWQKNWEEHINMLEDDFSGALYKTFLNTNFDNKFSSNPLNLKAYDYSVSKITLLTSIVLMTASFAMFAFYVLLFVLRFINLRNGNIFDGIFDIFCIKWIVGTVAVVFMFLFCIVLFSKVGLRKKLFGNVSEHNSGDKLKWSRHKNPKCKSTQN